MKGQGEKTPWQNQVIQKLSNQVTKESDMKVSQSTHCLCEAELHVHSSVTVCPCQ